MTPEQALHEAIEGRPLEGLTFEQRRLVRLARECERIEVAGPGLGALKRMALRFDRFLEENDRPGLTSWLKAWLGVGALPRPLAQRLAAAGLLAGIMGFGGAAASGVSPLELVDGLARFAGNVIENLSPRDAAGDDPVPTLQAAATPGEVTVSPTAGAQPTLAGSQTPATQVAGAAGVPGEPGGASTTPGPALTTETATPNLASPTATVTPGATPTATTTPSPTPTARPGEVTLPSPEPVDVPSVEPTAVPPPTVTPGGTPTEAPAASDFDTASYAAADAGTVTLRYSPTSLEVIEVQPAPGWTYKVEDVTSTSFKVEFAREGRRVDLVATLADGSPVITVTESDEEEDD